MRAPAYRFSKTSNSWFLFMSVLYGFQPVALASRLTRCITAGGRVVAKQWLNSWFTHHRAMWWCNALYMWLLRIMKVLIDRVRNNYAQHTVVCGGRLPQSSRDDNQTVLRVTWGWSQPIECASRWCHQYFGHADIISRLREFFANVSVVRVAFWIRVRHINEFLSI